MAIRVQQNPQDFGRCGCGRRQYCDGSHGLSEAEWQAKLAAEQAASQTQAVPASTESASTQE